MKEQGSGKKRDTLHEWISFVFSQCIRHSLLSLLFCLNFFSFFFSGESEILKFREQNLDSSSDLNRQHLGSRRPYFRSTGKTYRIRNGYTVTLECSIENLGELFSNLPLLQSSKRSLWFWKCKNGILVILKILNNPLIFFVYVILVYCIRQFTSSHDTIPNYFWLSVGWKFTKVISF